ncbi:MAG: PilX N-terminal domain-containing pilus assembly protein [Desulfobacterales bacterium]|nr:PilX N-terminal domain-containing pilus assembly protein [Desulfobacterales bacterium]
MKQKFKLENEKGSVTVLAVVLLMLLTLLGMAALSTSSIETQIAGNELRYKLAFYAAESAKAYVAWKPDLYGPDNITPVKPHYFPNITANDPVLPYVGITDALPTAQYCNSTQSFNGEVEYDSSSLPPRGSGYSVGKFKAHQYKMVCNGYSSNNTFKNIVVGFYRIGF